MKYLKRLTTACVFCTGAVFTVWMNPVAADMMSEATKIGANAGAMNYCEKRVASGDDKSKYKLLSLSAYKEFEALDSSDRAKALVYKKAAEDGDYLGDPLDQDRCDSVRKMLFIKYK